MGDPCSDRVVKEVALPPNKPLGLSQTFPAFVKYGDIARPNPAIIREVYLLDGSLDKKSLMKLINDSSEVFR